MEEGWGTGVGLTVLWPSSADDPVIREAWGRFQRMAASPGAALGLLRLAAGIDARAVLPTISVATLVLYHAEDRFVPAQQGRYLARHIPDARYVELPGMDHLPWAGAADQALDEIQEFLTGVRGGGETERVLATVLFSDIVGSTERAAALGDRRWRNLLESYYALVRRHLAGFRGREVDTAGDGFLATFDGPARAIRCAHAISSGVRTLGIEVRTGLHTGECEVVGDKVGGIAVHLGARVATAAGPGEVLVSSTVRDVVAGSGITFADRGAHVLKGIPGEWRLFAVAAHRGA